MRNTGLEEAQAGIKIAGRNINNLRYADDPTLMAESEEELKSLLTSSFRIWSSSAGIPSPPLAVFIVMLPKAHLTSYSKMPVFTLLGE